MWVLGLHFLILFSSVWYCRLFIMFQHMHIINFTKHATLIKQTDSDKPGIMFLHWTCANNQNTNSNHKPRDDLLTPNINTDILNEYHDSFLYFLNSLSIPNNMDCDGYIIRRPSWARQVIKYTLLCEETLDLYLYLHFN